MILPKRKELEFIQNVTKNYTNVIKTLHIQMSVVSSAQKKNHK